MIDGDRQGGLVPRDKAVLGGVLVLLLAVHVGVPLARGQLGRSLSGVDEQHYYAHLRSVVLDGDLDYDNELDELTPYPGQLPPHWRTSDGERDNMYPVGWAIVSLVPYALIHLAAVAMQSLGGFGPTTGYEPAYQLAASLPQLLAGWASC